MKKNTAGLIIAILFLGMILYSFFAVLSDNSKLKKLSLDETTVGKAELVSQQGIAIIASYLNSSTDGALNNYVQSLQQQTPATQ